MPRAEFMRLAIEKAREGVAQGQWPYGACLVKQDEVVACVHNVTRANMDPTGHAETHALREGCLKLNSLDLTGCEMYATCEPCPMCFAACHNAGVSTIVYGASLLDSPPGSERGSVVTAHRMKELLASRMDVVGGFLRDEVIRLYGP